MMAKKKSFGERRGPYDYWRFDGSKLTKEFGFTEEWWTWRAMVARISSRARDKETKAFFSMWFTEIDD
jgi:hypothetical protein